MHGDERAGWRVAEYMRRQAQPGKVTIYVVPTINPDGLAHDARTNAHGVDLNRNFPSGDWRLQGQGTSTYSGPSPASEPETRVMLRFLRTIEPWTVVSMHQPLACVDYSGGDPHVTRWLARHLDLPAKTLGASGGNLTTWFNHRWPKATAVTLEFASTTTKPYRHHVGDVLTSLAVHRGT
jgi:hypothetical protein